ncbi:MAG: hypothetical protein EOP15_05955 [Pseudomonas sp.]|nr:MAG: hypothetical protein EOP15_05955 [Pseudomonas sp.]
MHVPQRFSLSRNGRGKCRSGLVSRKGRAAAPRFEAHCKIAGAALQPFRDTRPLLHTAAVGQIKRAAV